MLELMPLKKVLRVQGSILTMADYACKITVNAYNICVFRHFGMIENAEKKLCKWMKEYCMIHS